MSKFKETKIPVAGSNRVALVKSFLDTHYDIKINIFDHSKVMIEPKTREYSQEIEIKDINLHMIEEGITGCASILKDVLTSPNQTKPFNPIKEYFEALEGNYAGTSHIDLLCSFLKVHDYGDKEEGYYHKRFIYTFRKWLVATVAQVMGLQANDAMFHIVNSETGMGKSWFFDFLVPEILTDYYTISVKDMSFTDFFCTNFLIKFDEMAGLSRSRADEFKNTMSANHLNVSKRFTVRKQRFASACGTSNYDDEHGGFLLPEYSLRRFAVNRIDHIDWEGYIKVVNVDQIWAEAVMLLSQNFNYVWNKADFIEFEEYNSRFLVQTTSLKLVKEFYRIPEPGEEDLAQFKQPVDILRELRAARKITSSMNTVSDVNIGIALKQLGYARYGKWMNGKSRYGYDIIPLF